MISNGGGRIINLSGMNSFSGAHWPHVCASKMGALGLTRALAVELAPHNILVNYVVPGGWDESATSLEDMAPESRGLERIPLRFFLAPHISAAHLHLSDPVGSDSRASDNPLKKPSGRSSD